MKKSYEYIDVGLDQRNKPKYKNHLGNYICEPCSHGYHEHHRQNVHYGENVRFGEADCKNLIDGGQCCCYQQPTGELYSLGIPYPFSEILCVGCKEIVKGTPNKYYRRLPTICKECGLGWEINEGGGGWAPTGPIPWYRR